jgi:DNA polymerase-3 subunit gamma/tau
MSSDSANPERTEAAAGSSQPYVVVARRYRPKAFDELIGQEHVAQALENAISTNRVGHAYLFTGARGVGKTSAARILAKALNCEKGPTPTPCNECDICQRITSGEDVDVLEIDGASNRGIDEIRQLRQNAGVRPSRSRFKIYIIDEVHMLTREAFNALLKTLEEPPEHVKFIFCTTEPTKIPITILSRCQRFDFAGILTRSIRQRLEQIVAAEGVEADSEALEIIARRAAGSMRDSQSLLEQLLAFSPGRVTVAEVHGMLGTAGDERLAALIGHVIERNAAGTLDDLDAALTAGVDAAQFIEQIFGCLRDCMVAAVGCPNDAFLYTSPSGAQGIAAAGKQLGLGTLLAIMQILDQTLSRMRYSTQGRILAELALVRICELEDLDELSAAIAQLRSGVPVESNTSSPAGVKKKYEPAVGSVGGSASVSPATETATTSATIRSAGVPPASGGRPARAPVGGQDARAPDEAPSQATVELTGQNAIEVWNRALAGMTGMVVDQAKHFDSVAFLAPNRLVIRFKPVYDFSKGFCERPEQIARFEKTLAEMTGQPTRVEFALAAEEPGEPSAAPTARAVPPHQRRLEAMQNPLVRRAAELFGAQVIDVVDPPPKEP